MKTTSSGFLFVISAPTGAGKSTIAKSVLQLLGPSLPISRVITYTTRPARAKEHNGVDYHFLTPTEFEQKKQDTFFLETTTYDGNWYGSPRSICDDLQTGASFLIITDRAGAKSLKALLPDIVLIWIDVPDANAIKQRLSTRDRDGQQDLQRRVDIAIHEMRQEQRETIFDYHVMNGNLNRAIDDVATIIRDHMQQRAASSDNV